MVQQVDAECIGEFGLDAGRLAGAARPEQEAAAFGNLIDLAIMLPFFTRVSATAMPFPEPRRDPPAIGIRPYAAVDVRGVS